jgi:hypothetical protein
VRENNSMLDNEFKATRAKLVRDLADRPFHQGEVATPRHQIRERAIPNTGHQASSAGDNCFEHAMRIAQIAPWPKAFLPNSTAAQSASLRGWWMSWSNSTTMSPCSRTGTPTHVASVTPSGHVRCAVGVPFLTTMHGRLDLPGLVDVVRRFPDAPFVSISNDQRLPLLGW